MTESVPPQQDKPAGLPLFYKNPVPLSQQRHARAGLRTGVDYGFARGTNGIALTGPEFALAARHYAIAFSTGSTVVPFAITGLREQENLFVTPDGAWQPDTYIPAYVRRYPFIFNLDQQAGRLILCIDEGGERYDPEGATQPFFAEGKPKPLIDEALKFCEAFHAQYEDTMQFGAWLEKEQMLEDRTARTTLEDGTVFTLRGFRLLNPEKLRTLTDEQVLFLHKRGWLPLLYFHMQSLNNWGYLGKLARDAKLRAA